MYIVANVDSNFPRGFSAIEPEDYVLNWTQEPPTKKGWYWATWLSGDLITIVLITEFSKTDHKLVAVVPAFDHPFEIRYFHLWLGPLPQPEFPKAESL